MGINVKKTNDSFKESKISSLGIIAFIVTIASSLILTIWALFIYSMFGKEYYVGYFISFLAIISFSSYFLLIPFIEKSSKSKLFLLAIITISLIYFIFFINNNLFLFIFLSIILAISLTIRLTCFGIMVKNQSRKNNLSTNEGFIYTLINIGWIIGPLIALGIITTWGIKFVFIISGIFLIISVIIFRYEKIEDSSTKKRIDYKVRKNFKEFFSKSERRISYFLRGGVSLWWSFIYLFIPLFIIRNGLAEKTVSYFFFLIPIPLILFEYYFSKKANKQGFKRIFQTGFLFVSLIALACFFVSNVYIILGLLIFAGIGMAMLEPTTEAYFFDISSEQQAQRFYGPFNTAIDVSNFIGQITGATLILFLPFKYLFLLFSFFMLIMFFISFKSKNIVESKRKIKLIPIDSKAAEISPSEITG